MRQLIILNLFIIGTMFSAFAQKTIATYDINEDRQTTVIVKDFEKSDQDILNELDLDDYTVGEEVYITAEMWAEIQAEKEKKHEPKINESIKVEEERTVVQNKTLESTRKDAMPDISTKTKVNRTATAKKKKKKAKRYRMKKPKRKKYISRRGKMACYSF